ncbi:HTH-type transcriptional repressor YvoA [Roseovarius litorisediminis]|uniref:HTH-type transcriptional repressor YvoA n=1 Tax=Roseovarius litorisediminis TaxID=1312363 RepID=A0A1Y5T7S9_9RHOB|nr:UTRA domain-containing protein [Roseovarius litorisediminis]SLN57691.1 HTH-type transcriptional repressor YvoA [Roseovarius litorisediminis]
MSQPRFRNWQAIQDEVLRRIHARDWPPGHVIPNEVDLAAEFGCARATVNRALRALAEAGMLERRRKAGTRVALHPVSRATVDIPVIRQEIEDRGQSYTYRMFSRKIARPPVSIQARLCPDSPVDCLHVTALHLASGVAYVFEDRWINLATVPAAANQNFDTISANEWLLATVPYTHGDISFTAEAAAGAEADLLGTARGAPVFVIDRTTWDHDRAITTVRLSYAPGYRIRTSVGTPVSV